MVYVDPKNLNYEPYIWTWCNKREDQEQAEVLRAMFDKYMDKCVDFVLEGIDGEKIGKPLHLTIPQTNLNLVRQCCNMLDFLAHGRSQGSGRHGAGGDLRLLPRLVCGRGGDSEARV